jgi:hypothetical protein
MMSAFRSPLRLAAPLIAVAGFLSTSGTATAGWDNVFQVCCHDCKPRLRSSYYAAPCPTPQPVRKVEYVQRSYYEPVTVMKPERYTEEVPVRVKSYYWDPVTSYTYTSYYDPCTCKCQQIAVPRTSYVRKESCNTVMKYVERIRMVPTQVQRQVTVRQPVVTYYYPEVKTYSSPLCDTPGAAPVSPPTVDAIPGSPPRVMPENTGGNIAPQNLPTTIPPGMSRPRSPVPGRTTTGPVNAHTTSRGAAAVRGEIVQKDRVTPRPGAKLVFVNAANLSKREYATADAFGNFDAKLPAGDWYVYLGNGDGRAVFHKKITVDAADARNFKVVSR